jgi:AAA15 family ATPase/GTPase
MLTTLYLTNFKAWRNTGQIRLAPVTMLLGTNSSGKSSLIQSLLLLKQTVQSSDRTIHLNLGSDESSDFFNFGDFDAILHQGAEDRSFAICFECDRSQRIAAAEKGAKKEQIARSSISCSYRKMSSGAVTLQSLALNRLSNPPKSFRVTRGTRGSFFLYISEDSKPIADSKDYAPERSIALPAPALYKLGEDAAEVQDISYAIRQELQELVYLGPLRRKPERDYVWNKAKPGEIGIDGHKAVEALLASALLAGPGRNEVLNSVSSWLARMQLATKLNVRQVGRSTRYEVVIDNAAVSSNLRDVGIGISQVLPVITVAFFAPPGSTILLEEPEIHLHPLAQSVLAELFVEVAQKRHVQFIVETHSEHLFRRMQTLIAREDLSTEDCELYFVEKDNGNAKLRRLELDVYGRVTNWPEHFFGNALGETEEQARLMFQRLMEGNTRNA